ncbi:hypothetical protein BGX30_012306 [Mortierella sp. GBA39]|nr:hypothetical protein BGX30_012306 [Mortierella sp. GBA39]
MSDQLDSLLTGIDLERQNAIYSFFNTLPVAAPTPAMAKPSERKLKADRRSLTLVKLGLAEWVQYTTLHLVNDANPWCRSSGLSIHTPWDTFETDFLTFHTPPNAVAAAREALEQGKRSVALYTHEFRRLLRRVPTLDKGAALH